MMLKKTCKNGDVWGKSILRNNHGKLVQKLCSQSLSWEWVDIHGRLIRKSRNEICICRSEPQNFEIGLFRLFWVKLSRETQCWCLVTQCMAGSGTDSVDLTRNSRKHSHWELGLSICWWWKHCVLGGARVIEIAAIWLGSFSIRQRVSNDSQQLRIRRAVMLLGSSPSYIGICFECPELQYRTFMLQKQISARSGMMSYSLCPWSSTKRTWVSFCADCCCRCKDFYIII